MGEKNYLGTVLEELRDSLTKIKRNDIEALTERMSPDTRIFCDAAGRSRLQIEGFAMRLTQMGWNAFIVGEPTAPAIGPKDLLLTASASGETPALVQHSEKAAGIGAARLLITASPDSSLGRMSDEMLVISAPSKADTMRTSVQPMGSLFEQSLMLMLDTMVLHLMEKYGISGAEMYANHANLE